MSDQAPKDKGGSVPHGPFVVLASEVVYDNSWIRVTEDRVIRPGGKPGRFGIVAMRRGASVLPLEADGTVYLAEEFKYAIGRQSIEVFSGGVEESETPLEAGSRELREELGMTAREWIEMGHVDPFTTVINCVNHLFLAKGLERGEGNPDEGEIIKVVRMPFERALGMVLDGEITHGASMIVILKAARLLGF